METIKTGDRHKGNLEVLQTGDLAVASSDLLRRLYQHFSGELVLHYTATTHEVLGELTLSW
jgi:DNA replicative helicase MCM subunit Mcm2 (Cdc46/Mcm family)